MDKLATGLSRKAGLIPGTLVHVGDLDQHPVRITLIDYDADHVTERELTLADDCQECKDGNTVTWINVEGVHDPAVIERIGSVFGLHPLVMEDVMNTEQRPKLEDYGEYLYIVVRMLYERPGDDEDTMEIDSEQVSLIVGPNVLFTFLEDPGDVFDPVRKRIRENRGRVRKNGADYLAYALIDVIVDNYFAVLERFGDLTEDLEQDVMGSPTTETLQSI
jgi:magnesium transporter